MRGGCRAVALIVLAGLVLSSGPSLTPIFRPLAAGSNVHPQQVPNHDPISIDGDGNFTAANGVVRGKGTAGNPFVIEGWIIFGQSDIPAVRIQNTRADFVVRNVETGGYAYTNAVALVNVSNGRIESSNVSGDYYPYILLVDSSSNVTVTASRIPGGAGSMVKDSDHIAFTNNVINRFLEIDSSTDLTMQGNAFTSLGGLLLRGTTIPDFASHTITPDNLVNGLPLRYRAGCSNESIDGQSAGEVIIANCDHVRIANVSIQHSEEAIQLAYVRNATVTSNNLTDNYFALDLNFVTDSVVTGNTVRDNYYGILLQSSSRNRVFHNDFLGQDSNYQTLAMDDRGSENAWNASYPEGGNFWSYWIRPDSCSGPTQSNCTSPDGIVDHPFPFGSNATDFYPLTLPVTYVDAPPSASFTVQPPPLRAWDPISFDGSASRDADGRIVTFAWDCRGDGSIVYSGSSTSCVYPREGIYNVSLTVIDDVGLQSVFTDPINVTAPITNPNPRVTMSAPYGFVGEPVTFDGSGSTDPYGWIVRWVWDFGDGNQSEGEVVSHSFTEARTHYVTLTVYNDRGSAAAVAEPVTVYALPPFEIYHHAAGFRLPVPIGWPRQENVTIGNSVAQLLVQGPSANNRATRILVATDLDPSVRETPAYLNESAKQVLQIVQTDYPDAFLAGLPWIRTLSNHYAVTFTIRIPSISLDQEATLIVREADHRYWLMLLTADDSIFPLASRVFDIMSAGFEITIPVPPSAESVFLLSALWVTLIVGSVLGSVLVLRAVVLRRPSKPEVRELPRIR